MQSCSAKRRRWSSPRQRPISPRSAASGSSAGRVRPRSGRHGEADRRRGRVSGGSSSVDIQRRTLQVRCEIVTARVACRGRWCRGSRGRGGSPARPACRNCRAEGQGERMAQGMAGNRDTAEMGAPCEAGDHRLDRADRQRGMAAARNNGASAPASGRRQGIASGHGVPWC